MQLAQLWLLHPITSAEKYVNIDNDVHENDGDCWEQRLLDDLTASSAKWQDFLSDIDDNDID